MSSEPPYIVIDGQAAPTPTGLALLCGITRDQLQAELDRLATDPDATADDFPEIWVRRAANTLTQALRTRGYAGLLPAVLDQLAAEQTSSPANP